MSHLATGWSRLHAWSASHGPELRLCVRSTTAAVLTLAAAQVLHLPIALWAVLTAVILTQISVGRPLKAPIDYLASTLGGAGGSARRAQCALQRRAVHRGDGFLRPHHHAYGPDRRRLRARHRSRGRMRRRPPGIARGVARARTRPGGQGRDRDARAHGAVFARAVHRVYPKLGSADAHEHPEQDR